MSQPAAANVATTALPADVPPPAPPRELTPAASRRAWREPRVKFWWVVALGVLTAAIWLAAQQAVAWNRDARLIRSGTRVDAVIWLGASRATGRPIAEDDIVKVEFDFNGQRRLLESQRLMGRGVVTLSGDTVPIFVDPDNLTRWTARTAPRPLLKMMMGALALGAMAVLLALVSMIKRRGVTAIWRDGEARAAAVVETSHSALAPRSRLVRCALTDGSDRRLINVYVPRHAAS